MKTETTSQRYIRLEANMAGNGLEVAAAEILQEKRKLRARDQRNPLLNLVLASCDGDIMYAENFLSVLIEHLPIAEVPPVMSPLEACGHYVDLLKEEQINPKYPPRIK